MQLSLADGDSLAQWKKARTRTEQTENIRKFSQGLKNAS
jgi:hypothetical protein